MPLPLPLGISYSCLKLLQRPQKNLTSTLEPSGLVVFKTIPAIGKEFSSDSISVFSGDDEMHQVRRYIGVNLNVRD